MNTVRVTCGHVEEGKKVVCEGCYKQEQARGRRLREALEKIMRESEAHCCEDCPCSYWEDFAKAALEDSKETTK